MGDESNTAILKLLNVAFENERKDRIDSEVDSVIRMYLLTETRRGDEPLTNTFSVFSNYLKMIIRKKLVNPNYILSSLIKWSRNYISLFLIGMVIREGANPNVYYPYPGRGNLHVIAWASVIKGSGDPLFYYIVNLLRMLGSDIYRPAIRFEGDSDDVDVRMIEQSFQDFSGSEEYYFRAGMNVENYVSQNGYTIEESLATFLNSIDDEWLLDMLIAADDVNKFRAITSTGKAKVGWGKNEWEYVQNIINNNVTLTRFIIDLSIASASNIVLILSEDKFPLINQTINGQTIPLFATSISGDRDLYDLFIRKGSSVKYVTINTLLTFYKIFKNNGIKLYESYFHMLNESMKIGAYMDLYQFNFFVSMADYDEIEKIRKSYQTPKWEKLCSGFKNSKERGIHFDKGFSEELRQIAFKLNLDYHQSPEDICNKLARIPIIGEQQFFESAIRRQEERVAVDTGSPEDFDQPHNRSKPRCSEKSMILKNPYAYNDAQMAFYKDHKTGEVHCFTSDTFASLITSQVNPYTGEKLPQKFLQTIKAQLNTLKEIGVYETNMDIKDALKEFYSHSVIDNKKTDRQYDTVIKVLSIYGVSQERFESLRSETLNDTILRSIANVELINFNSLPLILKQKTTSRIIYSLAKKDTPMVRESGEISDDLSKELFSSIAAAISDMAPTLVYPGEEIPPPDGEEDGYREILGGNY
jgi:hypothetical protein